EEETITAKAIAELDNAQGLWRPGVFVKVKISTETIHLPLVVSKEAVQNIEGKDFVFVKTREGIHKRLVTLGASDRDEIQVLSGLHAAELYAESNTFLLKAELGIASAEHEH